MPTDGEVGRTKAAELAQRVRGKEPSPVGVAEAVPGRTERPGPEPRASRAPTPDLARQEARRPEREFSDGADSGPLAGVPVGIEDLHAEKGRSARPAKRMARAAETGPLVVYLASPASDFVTKKTIVDGGEAAR